MNKSVVLSWSGGKDSALTLDTLQRHGQYRVAALLTTLTRDFNRISMHGVRRELLNRQAELAGIPLYEAWIQAAAGNDEYEAVMSEQLIRFRDQGIDTVAFGDLFLEDIREYRERLVGKLDMTPIFPVWGRNTTELAAEFVDNGFQALTCCVDTNQLPASFCGRQLTREFFQDLPPGVDPCGENGEFHSFVFNAPFLSKPMQVRTGDSREDGPFVFRDIRDADGDHAASNSTTSQT